ncbi:MAG: hypothetical protein BWY80_01118 [Firmicutes bacterium ADurb.Bin456]|nr:MAG: hypothetical protein BWY80_01118 [Firmicutes bacterium ADurb.Bin456]
MDVCDDPIVKGYRKDNIREQAWGELEMIEAIKDSKSDSRQKCEALLALLDGKTFNEINKIINA